MSKKTVDVQLRLPRETIEEMEAIAKIAGLSAQSVMKVILAFEVRRAQLAAKEGE